MSIEFPGALNRPPEWNSPDGRPPGPPPMNDPNLRPGVPNPNVPNPLQEQQQREPIAEVLMRRDYQSSMTIVGEDRIQRIKEFAAEGEYEALADEIKRALSLTEGLSKGVLATSYGIPEAMVDLNYRPPAADDIERRRLADLSDNVFAGLRNQFMTVEGSVDRGNVGYLRDAITESVDSVLRRAEEWEKDNGQSWRANRRKDLQKLYNNENRRIRLQGTPGQALRTPEQIRDLVERNLQIDAAEEQQIVNGIKQSRDNLLSLDLHIHGRFVIDSAYRQRQYVCHERDLQANMKQSVGLGTSEPDGNHFQGFYQVDRSWGDAVDRVERELVRMAIEGVQIPDGRGGIKGTDGIFQGNPDTQQFKAIMLRMLNASKINNEGSRRMDVVWAAWRSFHMKEIPAKFAMKLAPAKENGKVVGHKISFPANPPYVGDLHTWLSHPDEHRAMEYGWTWETLQYYRQHPDWNGVPIKQGDIIIGYRTKNARLPSHSGHPRGVGHLVDMQQDIPLRGTDKKIPGIAHWGKDREGRLTNPLGNFMEFTNFQEGQYKNHNLWDVWTGYTDERGYHQGISQSDARFPWIDTDLFGAHGGSDEFSTGPYSYWNLQRGRGWTVTKNMFLGVPDLRKTTGIANMTEGYRNLEKLGMVRPGGFMDNPVFVKLKSDRSFFMGTNNADKNIKGDRISEFDITSVNPEEMMLQYNLGENRREINFSNYVYHALELGVINSEEYKWLMNKNNLFI